MVCRVGFGPTNRNGAVLQTVCFNHLHTGTYEEALASWCSRLESNQRHIGLQPTALPTELQKQMVTEMGLEPILSSVKGLRLNQFVYSAI